MHVIQIPSNMKEVFHRNAMIADHGTRRLEVLSRNLQALFSDTHSRAISVFANGSDGRRENKIHDGRTSNMELSFVLSSEPAENIDYLIEKTRDAISLVIDNIDIKYPDRGDYLLWYENDPRRTFPTRIWDAVLLYGGSAPRASSIRSDLSNEILNSKKSVQNFADRFRSHRRILETGVQRFR